MLHDLEAADGWAELTYEQQTERIRVAFDAQFERDKARDPRKPEKGKWETLCKHGDCKLQSRGREGIGGVIRVVDEHSNLVCPMYRCGDHGGRNAGRTPVSTCYHPGCSKGSQSRRTQIDNPINKDLPSWRYCTVPHETADAPRRALFKKILAKLGQNDPDVQAKLTDLNAKQNKKDNNMTPAAALAQLNTILSTGTLQALQDALDAGPSGAGGA